MGDLGYTDFFLSCARNLTLEEVMTRSPNGKKVNVILEKVFELEEREIIEVSIVLVDKVGTCIIAGKKTKLPSVAQAQIWTPKFVFCLVEMFPATLLSLLVLSSSRNLTFLHLSELNNIYSKLQHYKGSLVTEYCFDSTKTHFKNNNTLTQNNRCMCSVRALTSALADM